MSTKFKHEKIHKGTWVATDRNTCNQTDHVLVNQNKSSMIQDVSTLRRPNCDSDHFSENYDYTEISKNAAK
jgi:hypothetical protein